jgi:hypothetical protein
MIIATPLDIPRIEPDDWDLFWNIWNTHSGPLTKQFLNNGSEVNPKSAPKIWRGLDLYDAWPEGTAWHAPLFEADKLFPKMFKTIFDLNLNSLYRVRVISSLMPVPAHSDDSADRWSIRAFLHHPSAEQQWYFTKPNDRTGPKKYLRMSEDTNWFAYHDNLTWHGTEYDPQHPKILLQLYSKPILTSDDLIQRSFSKYSDYLVEYK